MSRSLRPVSICWVVFNAEVIDLGYASCALSRQISPRLELLQSQSLEKARENLSALAIQPTTVKDFKYDGYST